MKAALWMVGTAGLVAQPPSTPPLVPASQPGGLPLDGKDHQPVLLGSTSAKAILEHRPAFRENLNRLKVPAALHARWKAVRHPLTLVAVFGSWCGDSRDHLPALLALEADPNPFIEVHYLGVYRDKLLDEALWPKDCSPRRVHKVPTFYVFAPQPGGAQKLVGTLMEQPSKPNQTMAEALVELVETSADAS